MIFMVLKVWPFSRASRLGVGLSGATLKNYSQKDRANASRARPQGREQK